MPKYRLVRDFAIATALVIALGALGHAMLNDTTETEPSSPYADKYNGDDAVPLTNEIQ